MAAADHLECPRQHGLFHHHGIDLGDGTVAHYLEGRQILRSPVEDFCRGQPIQVVTYPERSCSPAGATLRRAQSRLGEQSYNLLFNNCDVIKRRRDGDVFHRCAVVDFSVFAQKPERRHRTFTLQGKIFCWRH